MSVPRPCRTRAASLCLSDEVVKIRFYDDGSVRCQIDKATPMALKEAYLSGAEKDVILKLIPLTD